jgi:hypothetical protein
LNPTAWLWKMKYNGEVVLKKHCGWRIRKLLML